MSSNTGMSGTPLVPLSITPSINDAGDLDSSKDKRHSTQEQLKNSPSSVPPLPSRVPTRNISAQLRNSRTASLIIPVMASSPSNDEKEDEEKDDIVDLDVSIDDSRRDETLPDSPALPTRPPRTPTRPSSEFQPAALETYGMDRIKGSEFSPITERRSRRSFASFNHSDSENVEEEPFSVMKEKYLIQSRKYQVDYVINLLTKSNLTVANNVYFEKLHSSNDYIEVLSEIRTGSFDTGNLPILYSLLLNSLKLREDLFHIKHDSFDDATNAKFDAIIDGLSPLLRSTEQQKLQFKNDLIRVYSLFTITSKVFSDDPQDTKVSNSVDPNALVAAFVYRCASHNILPQAVIVALLIDEFVVKSNEGSREFHFLLLRSIEAVDEEQLLKQSEKSNPVAYIMKLINSNKFWCDLVLLLFNNDISTPNHPLGLTNVLHRFIIYGVNSLVDVIVDLRYELGIFQSKGESINLSVKKNNSDLVRFHREFLILNDSAVSQLVSYSLEHLSAKNQELESTLVERQKAYNELLHNYKQLNEEKISVAGQKEKANSENAALAAERRSLNAQVEEALGRFDVIKQTMEKNKRVQELNDSMSKEIERLTKENQRLRK